MFLFISIFSATQNVLIHLVKSKMKHFKLHVRILY